MELTARNRNDFANRSYRVRDSILLLYFITGCPVGSLLLLERRDKLGRLKNTKHEDFAQEYAKTGNAYQSAVSAGYSEKYAKGNSYKLVEISGISERIKEIHAEIEKKLIERSELEPPMSDEELLSLLYGVARQRPYAGRTLIKTTTDGETTEMVKEYQYSPNTEDKLVALDKIARIKGMYLDKLEIGITETPVFVDDLGDDDG